MTARHPFKQDQAPLARTTLAEGRVIPLLAVALLLCVCFLVLSLSMGGDLWQEFAAGATALVIFGGSITAAAILARKDRRYLFLPISGFLVACAIYFGAGSLIYFWGTDFELAELNSLVQVTPSGLAQVMLLNAGSMALVLVCYSWWRLLLAPLLNRVHSRNEQPRSRKLDAVVLVLALVGLYVRYRYALPFDLRISKEVPAGLLIGLTIFTYGAHYYFWEQAGRGERRIWPLLPLLFADMAYGFIALAKTPMFLPALAAFLGYSTGHRLKPRAWLGALAAAVLAAMILQPVNTYFRYGRALSPITSVSQAIQGLGQGSSVGEGLNLLQGGDLGSFWSRISYTGDELYSIQAQARGERGNSYDYLVSMWVPRWFWPEKPIVNPGADYAYKTRGLVSTATSPTLFGEAYFNLGTPGLLLFSLIISLVFLLYEIPARWVLLQRKTEYGLVLFTGIFIGLRIDDWAVMIVGAVISSMGLWALMAWLSRLARSSPRAEHNLRS